MSIVIACLAAWAGPAAAGPINRLLICVETDPCTITESTSGPIQDTSTSPLGTLTGFADGNGGRLRASALFDLLLPSPVNGQFNADAQFLDELTIRSNSYADGTPVFLAISFSVDGSIEGAASAVLATWVQGPTGQAPRAINILDDYHGLAAFQPMPIILGQPFGLVTELIASLYLQAGVTNSGSADFAHTAVLTGIQVYLDQAGTSPVRDLKFQSTSGLQYTPNGIVPEPSTILLIGAAVGLLTALRLRPNRGSW